MTRSTASRLARNSDSVMIGGRRRPDSRPSRLRCRFASSLVEPLIALTSEASPLFSRGVRTCTTVLGGSSCELLGGASVSALAPVRRRRLRRFAVPPGSSGPSSPCWSWSFSASTCSCWSSAPVRACSAPSAGPPVALPRPRPPRRRRLLAEPVAVSSRPSASAPSWSSIGSASPSAWPPAGPWPRCWPPRC